MASTWKFANVHRFARLSFGYIECARTIIYAPYHDDGCWGIDCCLFLYGIRLAEFALLHQLIHAGVLPELVLTACFPVHAPFVCAVCLLSCYPESCQ